jgi:hypothetical protein
LHAALLRASGQNTAAEQLASKIDTSGLTPEEKALLER